MLLLFVAIYESVEQKLQRFIASEPSRIKITFCKQRRIKELDNLNAKSLAHFVNHPQLDRIVCAVDHIPNG